MTGAQFVQQVFHLPELRHKLRSDDPQHTKEQDVHHREQRRIWFQGK